MAKLQIIENEYGERALVKKSWGLTWYRLICLDEWNPFPHWYENTPYKREELDKAFEGLLARNEKKSPKHTKVIKEVEWP